MADSKESERIMKTISATTRFDRQSVSPAEPGFPSVRYFQIHFEHLHETIEDLRRQVDQANRQIAELQHHVKFRVPVVRIGPENQDGERPL